MRIFGHHVPRKVLLLAGVEGLIIYGCLALALVVQAGGELVPGAVTVELTATALIALLSLSLLGLYEADQLVAIQGWHLVVLRIVIGLLVALGIVAAYGLLAPAATLQNGTVSIGLALASVGLVAERSLYRSVTAQEAFKHRLLVLGTGSRAAAVEHVHPDKRPEELPYKVMAYIAPVGDAHVDMCPSRVTHLQEGQTLLDLVREHRAHELVVAVRDRRGNLPIRDLLDCKLHGVRITDISTFFERERQQLRLDSLNTSWLVFGSGFRQDRFRNTVKRGFDLLASSSLLLVTLPVMLITALAIRLDSPGPVFYRQTRVGAGNEPFDIYKFRSMRQDAERDGVARWAQGDDDRITRVGRIIRKLRIDELPQVINVFKGEMSFVGPRPERPFFVDQLSEQIPYFTARHSIRPGITGWAQVRYAYGASVHDAREKLQYDLYYVKNHTLFLDIVILLETVKVVLFGRGAR